MRQTPGLVIAALLCAAASGCSTPVGRYFARRAADLGDCVEAEVGLGWPVAPFLFPKATGYSMDSTAEAAKTAHRSPSRSLLRPNGYVRMKATDFLVLGSGYAQPISYGWRGRYRSSGTAVPLAAGMPIYRNHEEVAGTSVHTEWTVLTTRAYDAAQPGPGGKVAEKGWLGVWLTLLVSVRLELNALELGDFLAGWVGVDLLGDDDWHPNTGEERK